MNTISTLHLVEVTVPSPKELSNFWYKKLVCFNSHQITNVTIYLLSFWPFLLRKRGWRKVTFFHCHSIKESASPLFKEIHSSQFFRQVFLVHRLAIHGVVLVALAVAQILHQPGWCIPQMQWDWGQRPLVVSQAGFDIVVGTIHLNRLWSSGKIDYTLGQKHLGEK